MRQRGREGPVDDACDFVRIFIDQDVGSGEVAVRENLRVSLAEEHGELVFELGYCQVWRYR